MKPDKSLLRQLSQKIYAHGVAVEEKKLVTWTTGWFHDRPGSWEVFLKEWNELTGGADLYVFQVWDRVVFTMIKPDPASNLATLREWAGLPAKVEAA